MDGKRIIGMGINRDDKHTHTHKYIYMINKLTCINFITSQVNESKLKNLTEI